MKYEVQQYTLCDGWINCWHIIDGNGKETPQVFDTEEDAQAELDEFFADIAKEIFHGERAANEGYDLSEFRIVPVDLSSEAGEVL
jgi:hypothetical protein